MQQFLKNNPWLLCFFSGVALTFAFAPFYFYGLAFVTLIPLFYFWHNASPKEAFVLGGAFGLGFFGLSCSWVFVSIHQFGNTNILVAGLITFIFILYLALYPAVQGYLMRRVFKHAKNWRFFLILAPVSCVAFEALRSWVITGFPWMDLGYSQTTSFLKGFAPLIGVYGISFIVAFIAGCLIMVFASFHSPASRTRSEDKKVEPPKKSPYIKRTTMGMIILIFFIAGSGLDHIDWTKPSGKPIKVSLVQGNISQKIKWEPSALSHILKIYSKLTANHWDSNIIVWPEAAVPTLAQDALPYLQQLNLNAKYHGTSIIVGAPTYKKTTNQYFNSLFVIGNGYGVYQKRHLVPFGEYIPLESIFSKIMGAFNIPMSNFSAGNKDQALLFADNISIAAFICYEIAYSSEVINSAMGSNLLVTASDDSWFGHSFASSQQMQMAVMRSLETARYNLYSTNTGVTAVISPKGKIIDELPSDTRAVLTAKVIPMQGLTPLMRFGYYFLMGFMILLTLLCEFASRMQK